MADDNELEFKPWWLSKGILGGVASALAGLAGIAGYTLDADTLLMLLSNSAAVVAGVVAVMGRLNATTPIKK